MQDAEYSVGANSWERSDGRTTNAPQRLRRLFFALAAMWGFGTGAAAIAAGLRMGGVPFSIDGTVWLVLVPSALVAAIGGVIASEAYRETRHRRR